MILPEPDLRCRNVWAPFSLSITTATVAASLSIVTVPGNFLISWAVICNPKGNLKTPFNFLVLNLAIADLIVGVITEPLFVGYHLAEAFGKRSFETHLVASMSYFMTSTASVLGMAALAVNRYQATTTKNDCIQQWKWSRVVAMSVLIWVFSLCLPFLYLVTGFCRLSFIFVNTAVVSSVFVLVFVYCSIYRALRKHGRKVQHLQSINEKKKRGRQEERITALFILIVVSFLACVVPTLVTSYIINLCHSCSCFLIHWSRDLSCWFLLLNSASNQFLYAWRMPPFRRAVETIPVVHLVSRWFGKNRVKQAPRFIFDDSQRNGKLGRAWLG